MGRSTEYWTEKEAVSTSVRMSFKNMTSLFELTGSMKTHFKAIMWFCCDDSFVNDEHQLCASRLCARSCDISSCAELSLAICCSVLCVYDNDFSHLKLFEIWLDRIGSCAHGAAWT